MKNFCWILYLALAGTAVATNIGDSYDQVVAERGKPRSQVAKGPVTMLSYADVNIKLSDGRVVEIKSKQSTQNVVKAVPPSPTRAASASSAPASVRTEEWTTDYTAALASASAESRNVFLFFTGSNWCGWCKRLNREILSTPDFKSYASEKLVLVELDFPRGISQPAELRAQNRQLLDQYQIGGYPTVVVLNPDGKVVGRLGYQQGGPGPFIDRLKSLETN